MVTYVYECPTCGQQFEARQKMSEPALINCRTAGCEGAPRRVILPSVFVLKGKGWFKDGY